MAQQDTTALPTGTVTFVFTDIEGSTRRAAELGDGAWAELLQTHDHLLRDAIETHGGVEVKTDGDAFFVAFQSATDATSAAVEGQRALETHPWPDGDRLRVRMGLHTGEAIVRNGDYVGHDVHRASRICDAAHGAQLLVSQTTADLVQDALPEGAHLADLGPHRLKDLAGPQRLFAITAPDLPRDFPPLRTLEGFPNNLPVQRSAFVGRDHEIARVAELLETHSLVTLTGVGGCGKTRLALQVAAEQLERHPDGVFFVDLAPLADPELVARTVADAVGLRLEGGLGGGRTRPLVDLLVDVLAQRHCLFVLDNCEHLLDASAELADRILASCPEVRVLATSREPLEVEGEAIHRVPSLSLPEEDADDEPSEAVDLFVDRATVAGSDFELGPENRHAVAAICRRLDGIPLAIEFAAARMSHLSAEQIAARLDDRFRLLTGGRRRVPRQQTLEAALDWSFELLDEAERQLLRHLAVFAGTFTLERVEDVCADEGVDSARVLDLLGALVDKSLVDTATVDGRLRYRLLETVRSFAEAKLREAGEAERYRSRHRDAYLAWLESATWEDLYFDVEVLASLVRELPNIRAALEWSEAQGRHDLVGRMAARGITLWWTEGHNAEGQRWLKLALDHPEGLTTAEQAACHLALAATLRADIWRSSDLFGNVERAIELAIELGRDHLGGLLVEALGSRAMGAAIKSTITGNPRHQRKARALADELIEAGDDYGSPWSALARHDHGHTMLVLGETVAAERSFAAVIEAWAGPATPIHTWVAAQLATCRVVLGDPEGALEATRWATNAAPPGLRMPVLIDVAAAVAELRLGEQLDAAADLKEALNRAHSGLALEFNACLLYAGAMAHDLGDSVTGARLLAAAIHVGAARDAPAPFHSPATYALYRHYVSLVRASLGSNTARRSRDEGRAMSFEDALATALQVVETLRGNTRGTSDNRATR